MWASSFCLLCLIAAPITAGIAAGQSVTAEALAAAQANAEKTEKAWFALAQGLDAKLDPLLPCDPAARKAIQDLSRASDARTSALMEYLRLKSAQAADLTQNARRLLEAEESRAPEAADERTDASLERSAIQEQNTNLGAGVNARPTLSDARNQLGLIDKIAAQRATYADQYASARDRGVPALRDLVAAYQARETALRQEMAAFQTESARWNTYYSVRLSRAQAECTAIGGSPAGSAPAKGASKGKKKQ